MYCQKLAFLEARAFQRHRRRCSFKGPPLKSSPFCRLLCIVQKLLILEARAFKGTDQRAPKCTMHDAVEKAAEYCAKD